MNDPNKAINVNLSSLLSLKAELLRKQAEVSKAKSIQTPVNEYVAKKSLAQNLDDTKNKLNKLDNSSAVKKEYKSSRESDIEDVELLSKSQRVLKAKTKYYERMTRTGGKLNSDDNCLVLFNRKQQDEQSNNNLSESEADDAAEEEEEEDWVEYTDCLGRTRKCLRKDLEQAKKRDAKLAASMPERLDQTKANWSIDIPKPSTAVIDGDDDDNGDDVSSIIGPLPTESLCSEALTVISKQDEVRAKWESKELENLDKKGVHYQDVFFDEARQHGVGYYAFSTDETERQKQQRELEDTRQRTIDEQAHRDTLRAQREKIIAQRVLAAKNRQRARLGQPPLSMSDLEAEKANQLAAGKEVESKETRKERKKQEKAKLKLEKLEIERDLERQQHIRPWDIKKMDSSSGFIKAKNVHEHDSDVDAQEEEEEEWIYKPEREPMSQEQWNEKQRAERKAEFAPPTNSQKSNNNDNANEDCKRRNFTSMPPPSMYSMSEKFNSFQSTKFKRRNYVAQEADTEEIYDTPRVGVAIPPPMNLDAINYAKKPKSNAELESSIEAGLRFLRHSSDKDLQSSKHNWTAKADYQ